MSDDDSKIEIGATEKEGIIILRKSNIPIFILPKGTKEDTVDVLMQINFIKYCMGQPDFVSSFLDFIEEQEKLIEEEEKQTQIRKKRKGFTLIKKLDK